MDIKVVLYKYIKFLLEIFIIDRKKRRVLKGEFCQKFLKSYINEVEKEKIQLIDTKISKYRIWQYWDNGVLNAPDIVKACMASVKKHCGDKEIVVLDDTTIQKYVEIPEYIVKLKKDGKMSKAHFSDILRTYLLYEYGGCWIDATVYMTAPLPDFVYMSELFVFQSNQEDDPDNLKVANYFISSQGKSILIAKMKRFLENYWSKNSEALNYFFYLHALTLFSESSNENKLEWDAMFKFPYVVVQQMEKELLSKYSEERYLQLIKMSAIHKLSYKPQVFAKKKKLKLADTLYQYIIEIYLSNFNGLLWNIEITVIQNIRKIFTNIINVFKAIIKKKQTVQKKVLGLNSLSRRKCLIVVLIVSYENINTIYENVLVLLNQTVRPDKLILWLDKKNFLNDKNLCNLKNLEKYGLEIRFYDEASKKVDNLISILKLFSQEIVIMLGENFIYEVDTIEKLYELYLLNTNSIYMFKRVFFKYIKKFHIKKCLFKDLYNKRFELDKCGLLFPPKSLTDKK